MRVETLREVLTRDAVVTAWVRFLTEVERCDSVYRVDSITFVELPKPPGAPRQAGQLTGVDVFLKEG